MATTANPNMIGGPPPPPSSMPPPLVSYPSNQYYHSAKQQQQHYMQPSHSNYHQQAANMSLQATAGFKRKVPNAPQQTMMDSEMSSSANFMKQPRMDVNNPNYGYGYTGNQPFGFYPPPPPPPLPPTTTTNPTSYHLNQHYPQQ